MVCRDPHQSQSPVGLVELAATLRVGPLAIRKDKRGLVREILPLTTRRNGCAKRQGGHEMRGARTVDLLGSYVTCRLGIGRIPVMDGLWSVPTLWNQHQPPGCSHWRSRLVVCQSKQFWDLNGNVMGRIAREKPVVLVVHRCRLTANLGNASPRLMKPWLTATMAVRLQNRCPRVKPRMTSSELESVSHNRCKALNASFARRTWVRRLAHPTQRVETMRTSGDGPSLINFFWEERGGEGERTSSRGEPVAPDHVRGRWHLAISPQTATALQQ